MACESDKACPLFLQEELEMAKANAHRWWLEAMRLQKELDQMIVS